MSIQGNLTVMKYPPSRSPSPPARPTRTYTLPSGKEITSEGIPTPEDRKKLDTFLSNGLPSVTSTAQKFVLWMDSLAGLA